LYQGYKKAAVALANFVFYTLSIEFNVNIHGYYFIFLSFSVPIKPADGKGTSSALLSKEESCFS
jgi:hypothetical protein